MLPDVPKDESEDKSGCRHSVYIFMRWNGKGVGKDRFNEFVEALRGMGISVERVEDTKMLVIKGRGVIGIADTSISSWYALHPDTINWLIKKCKEERNVDAYIHDIMLKAEGEYVTCEEIEEFATRAKETYFVTLAVILDVTDSSILLYKTLLKYLGQPNLIRPY
jgi:hypothetical protein